LHLHIKYVAILHQLLITGFARCTF